MSLQAILSYLEALAQNNNRDWYHEHKSERKEANSAFEGLIADLILKLRERDNTLPLLEPETLTFKLTRDTRFSHDKSPYNPAFRAHIAPSGKLPVPVGYFLFIRPGGRSFLGGGLFADMFQNATAMVRDFIAANGAAWQAVIDNPEFTNYFKVGGTALKNVPKGYDRAHPQAEFLKNKSWYLEYSITDEQLLGQDFLKKATEVFTAMQPFNRFLNNALKDFQLPSR